MTATATTPKPAQPPCNLDAERAVLGGALISPTVIRSLIVEEHLRPEHFYREQHQLVFAAMTALSDAERHVDVLTVTAHLQANGRLENAGGAGKIDDLTASVPGLGGIRDYARLVVDEWRWRQRLTSAHDQIAAGHSRDEPAFDTAIQSAHQLVALSTEESFVDPDALAAHMFDWLAQEPEPGLPLPVELSSLGRIVRLRAGHVTIIGGWSHHGKTMLAGQLVAAAGGHGHKAVVWTNEDTPEELVARHVQRMSGVPAVSVADRQLRAEENDKVVRELGRLPFGVQPCFGWSALQIARHIRQVRPALAVLDHFHMLPGVSKTDGIDDAMQTLVAAAGQAPCHLIVVCQLNQARNIGVVRPAPVGRDLRGSGQLFALAHTILLVYRQEEECQDDAERPLGRAVQLEDGHVDVVKNKPMGKLGMIPVVFDDCQLRFVERTSW